MDISKIMGFHQPPPPPTQGFEIHGSTGAPLPEKNYGWQKNIEEYLKKNPQKKTRLDPEC